MTQEQILKFVSDNPWMVILAIFAFLLGGAGNLGVLVWVVNRFLLFGKDMGERCHAVQDKGTEAILELSKHTETSIGALRELKEQVGRLANTRTPWDRDKDSLPFK